MNLTRPDRRSRPFGTARLAAVVTVAAAASLVLAACGGTDTTDPAGSAGAAGATGEPTAGGDLTIGTYLDPVCIDNQQIGTNASLSVTRQIVDSLTEQDPETGEILPWLATEWTTNADSSVFTFVLRDDVTFSDGTAFTAESVKTNLDAIVALGAKSPLAGPYLAGLTGVTVVDPTTVEIAFDRPNAQFLQATSNIALGMVSDATSAMTAEERCAAGVVGTGPFTLDSYVANDSVVLSKRDGYAWAPPSSSNTGEAYLDTVTFQVLPENSVRTGALLSGQIDAMDSVQQQDEAMVSSGGFSIISRPNPGFAVSILFKLDGPVGSDPAVRRAMMIGIDRADALAVLGPTGAETLGLLTPTTPGAVDLSEFLAPDPAEAATILDEAGWEEGEDGVREKDGVRLELDFPYFFDGPVVELLQQEYAKLGIQLNIRQITAGEFIATQESGDFDATVGNLTRADIDVLRSLMTSAGANYFRFADPSLQDLLVAQAAEPDATARADIAQQAQELVLENAYAVPLHAMAGTYAVRDGVEGLAFEASTRLSLIDTHLTD